ncbi:uncharacterized protein LOC119735607 [Patiria miniata]|uniref:Uncharacterized protein n=1 Tax=Patiria miniata TaxID=46514 RepID=A0A914AP94_PATMI|nr:uncharacterized protein LOC119735607 [Patiria miniata]
MMVDLRVKVRICISRPSSWLWLLLVFHFILQSATLPVTTPPRTEADLICQSKLGEIFVYDEGVGICVSCRSCQCAYITGNPHCVKCVDYGILPCQTTTAQVTAQITAPVTGTPLQESTPSLQTSMQTTEETPLMAFMTTMQQNDTAETNANNVEKATWSTVVGFPLIAVMVTVVGVPSLVFGVFMWKRRPSTSGAARQQVPTQETGKREPHPSTDLTGVIPPNHEFSENESCV